MAVRSVSSPPPARPDPPSSPPRPPSARHAGARLFLGDALQLYSQWPSPVVIVSDGAYGVSGFPGDSPTPAGLVEWYRPHVAE